MFTPEISVNSVNHLTRVPPGPKVPSRAITFEKTGGSLHPEGVAAVPGMQLAARIMSGSGLG
jgi:hypothetical protein